VPLLLPSSDATFWQLIIDIDSLIGRQLCEQRLVSLLVQIDREQLAHALHIARGRLEDQIP
jgi:hypothetical protein